MSIKLDDGSRFRIIDNTNKDVTTDKIDDKKVKIQIDVDKDGKFDGKNDLTIDDPTQIKLLTDDIKGNSKVLQNIPFVNEIEEHILNSKQIIKLLAGAQKLGLEAKETSILKKSKKIKLGKAAFENTQSAFYTDKENTNARFIYGIAIARMKDSFWRNQIQDSLEINLDNEAKVIISELEKDKDDIAGQMVLEKFYDLYDQKGKQKETGKWLAELKQKFPDDYIKAEEKFKMALEC